MSLAEVGTQVGVNADQISKLERGERGITTDWLDRLLNVYQMTHTEFYGEAVEPDTIPLLGDVPAGVPMLVDGTHLAAAPRFTFPQAKPDWWAVRVSGDSMNLVAQDGYVLIVCPHFSANELDGKFVIANYNGEATFKRYRAKPIPMLEPRSTNATHESIVPSEDDELVILGVVRYIVADLWSS